MDWTLIGSIVIGVTTGVVANLCSHFFMTVVLPAYWDRVYQGIRIDGAWTLVEEATAVDAAGFSCVWHVSVDLVQKAHVIRGSASAVLESNDGKPDVITYDVTGVCRDRFVQIHFQTKNRRRIACSSFLLEIVGDGSVMSGYRVFYGLKKKVIRARSCSWKARGSN